MKTISVKNSKVNTAPVKFRILLSQVIKCFCSQNSQYQIESSRKEFLNLKYWRG